jgi:hypothetical protein
MLPRLGSFGNRSGRQSRPRERIRPALENLTGFERGEIVYLAAEVSTGGRIHEIGTCAEVRSASDSELELELGGSGSGTARCPTHYVVRARERRTQTPAPGRSWRVRLRPAA